MGGSEGIAAKGMTLGVCRDDGDQHSPLGHGRGHGGAVLQMGICSPSVATSTGDARAHCVGVADAKSP